MRLRARGARTALWAAAAVAALAAGTKHIVLGATRAPRVDELAERRLTELIGRSATAVPAPQAVRAFIDVADDLGAVFVHDNAARGRFLLPEEMGPGVGLVDYDGDSDLDLFVAGGGAIIDDGPVQRSTLFRNDGARFTDVTDSSRAGVPGPAYGVACADYDDDGDVDIFVSRLGPCALLRNDGGSFTEIAKDAGVAGTGFGASCAFLDYDHDGRLDLYVTRYVGWTVEHETACYINSGLPDYCNPLVYDASSSDLLYRNVGGGRFEDVSAKAGISRDSGNGLGVVTCDFDGDEWIDIYVANDQTPAFLWRNRGDGTFQNDALRAGCAYDRYGTAIAGMGVASEDIDGDGDFDLIVSNIFGQTHMVMRNDGGSFHDVSREMGLADWSLQATGFGVCIFDQDHDGALDVFFANGAVNISTAAINAPNPYAEPSHFARFEDGRLADASAGSGADFVDVARSSAIGDIDGDGDLDLIVTTNGGALRILRNECPRDRSWLMVDARTGPARRAAIGARIAVRVGEETIWREIRPQQSYLASGDPRAHFGLGAATKVDEVTVRFPGGDLAVQRDVAVNQVLLVIDPAMEGEG